MTSPQGAGHRPKRKDLKKIQPAPAAADPAAVAGYFRSRLKKDGHRVETWLGLGAALLALKDEAGAEEAYRTVLKLQPGCAAGFAGLANLCLAQKRFDQALDHCGKAIILNKRAPQAADFITAGRALAEMGRYDEALASLASARALEPANPDVYFELGLIYEDQGKTAQAFEAYQTVLQARPRDVRVYNNLAAVLITTGHFDLAIATARMAVALAPLEAEVYLNLAAALRLRGDQREARDVYEKILALQPAHGEALVELSHLRQHACDWEALAAQQEQAWHLTFRQGRLISPFIVMTASAAPRDQLLCARVWGARLSQLAGAPLASPSSRPDRRADQKLRLGYLSADFHNHATAMLIAGMLEHHDKQRFELFAYSLGPDDGSALRQRLAGAFDHFQDLRLVSDRDAARRIHDDEIDILLDLKGYTRDARVKILAARPAPLQVNYLGYPATMGAPFIDYIIADPHVAPMAHQDNFDEKIVHLPHCYQPNDRKRPWPAPGTTRAQHGLPDEGFVFCSFNSPYKITPEMFAIWVRLLRDKPGSVLWLLAPEAVTSANLCKEAARRGIAEDRLVFAPFVTPDQHLARLPLADLFLDSYPVNAHTTAGESLWMGLPLITCEGETFASRVASSLLHAAGVPELVTATPEAYESLAAALADDRDRLLSIRQRLRDNRLIVPLFDTERYTRHFEQALWQMHQSWRRGEKPRAFSVSPEL